MSIEEITGSGPIVPKYIKDNKGYRNTSFYWTWWNVCCYNNNTKKFTYVVLNLF